MLGTYLVSLKGPVYCRTNMINLIFENNSLSTLIEKSKLLQFVYNMCFSRFTRGT